MFIFYFIDSEWVACRLIETNCVRSAFNSTQCSLFFMNASLIDDDSLNVCKWDSTRLIVFACNLLLCTVFEKRTMTVTVYEMTTE